MKSIIKIFFLLICLLMKVSGDAQEVSKIVNMRVAGTFSDYISDAEKYLITNLAVTGNLNGTDIRFIREMGGSDVEGKATDGKLTVLDLSKANIVSGGDYYYRDEANGYLTTNDKLGMFIFINCNFVSATIPATVSVIGNYAFWNCKKLVSVTIPESVTTIDETAFSNCPGLKAFVVPAGNPSFSSFEDVLFNKDKTVLVAYPNAKSSNYLIPGGVTSIRGYAFGNSEDLLSVNIGKDVSEICAGAFWNCVKLKEISAPVENPNYSSFGDVLFDKNKKTLVAYPNAKSGDYTIPDGVTCIDKYAFGGCVDLTSVTMPEGLLKIEEFAFFHCSGLTSVAIPSSVVNIGKHAFRSAGLTSMVIPEGITEIGEATFYECTGLKSLTFPRSVTSIGDYLFAGCYNLTSIVIPENVTKIGEYAFDRCAALTSVTIGNRVVRINDCAFQGCSGLATLTIPESVTEIGNGAFASCTSLARIIFPDHLTSIGGSAFYKTAWYDKQPKGVLYIGQVLYEYKDVDSMPRNTSVIVKEGTAYINEGAFFGAINLTSITIPNSVIKIGDAAFRDCNGLVSATIGTGVSSIGRQAFYGMLGLNKLYCLNTIPPVCGDNAFWPTDAGLYVPPGSQQAYQEAAVWKEFKTISEVDFTSIAESGNDRIKIYGLPGKIFVEHVPEGQQISINDLEGRLIYKGNNREVPVGSGLYIVTVGKITQKVSIE